MGVTNLSQDLKHFLLWISLTTAMIVSLAGCIDKQPPAEIIELQKVEITDTPQLPTLATPTSTETPTSTLTPTETEIPTQVPTEKPLIDGNIFFDPQSEADFGQVVEAPSPIDNPVEFAAWQNKYLEEINKKLETYNGPYMKLEGNGIDYGGGMYIFGGNEWKVMASYQFPWTDEAGNQHTIINKTYVFMDAVGNKIPLTVTYSLLSSAGVWDVDKGFVTPTNKSTLYIRYEWETAKKYFDDPFVDTLLPDRDKNVNFEVWRKVLSGIGASKEDIEIAIRVPMLFGMFGKVR